MADDDDASDTIAAVGFIFYPRNAMLARYLLSSCVRLSVRPSVCHKPVLYKNG